MCSGGGADAAAADPAPSITQMPALTTRERRRVIEGTAAAALLSALPSALISLRRHRSMLDAAGDLLDATRAAGTLLPPGREGLVAGTVAHFAISAGCGELLARTLPQSRSVIWGAGGGLAIGVVNLVVIGRRFPRIRALPLAPQLADNVAFGIVFALVADR
jgi:hypothetical protein